MIQFKVPLSIYLSVSIFPSFCIYVIFLSFENQFFFEMYLFIYLCTSFKRISVRVRSEPQAWWSKTQWTLISPMERLCNETITIIKGDGINKKTLNILIESGKPHNKNPSVIT